MGVKYVLPCPCGVQTNVEPRQAGQIILCSCGAPLQVPTLLDMTALEPASVDLAPESAPEVWGSGDRLRLIGAMLVLAALIGGLWLYFARPISRFNLIDPEQIRQNAQKLPASQTWALWQQMKQGLDRRTDEQYAEAVLRFRLWQAVIAGATLVGVALIAAGAAMAKRGGHAPHTS
jgi:hypothetical protein